MKQIIIIVAALLIAFFAYIYLQPKTPSATDFNTTSTDSSNAVVFSDEELVDIPPTYNESVPVIEAETYESTLEAAPVNIQTLPAVSTGFVCDSRKHCSQMTSCAEATYFSNNCPDTKMDGNNDGVPCEKQWCN